MTQNALPNPIIEKVESIKKQALSHGASDIFLSSGAKPSCRMHGKTLFFEEEEILSKEFLESYLHEIMSEEEKALFGEQLELDFAITISGDIRFRINSFWHMGGISIVFRHIPAEIPDFESLNLPEQLHRIPHFKNGLVLITGAMGTGKSTTLAALIDSINTEQNKHIITIEDPVEFIHQNKNSLIEQREVGVHSKTFNKALKSCLRQAADVILVGELRDIETISAAITAAETGALVLATLHTNGATKTINRLIDVFPTDQQEQVRTQLAETLRCVVWQTLVPLKHKSGRVAAFEILFQNYAVSNLIRTGKTFQLESIIETGQSDGMIPMKKSLDQLVQQDLIEEDIARKIVAE